MPRFEGRGGGATVERSQVVSSPNPSSSRSDVATHLSDLKNQLSNHQLYLNLNALIVRLVTPSVRNRVASEGVQKGGEP